MKKQELFIKLMEKNQDGNSRNKVIGGGSKTVKAASRQKFLMIVPKNKNNKNRNSLNPNQVDQGDLKILQNLVYGNKKKKSSFFK